MVRFHYWRLYIGGIMFHVIVNDFKVLAQEYEPEHRYSTYTVEGGCWSSNFTQISECLGDNPNFRMVIFETKEAAVNEAKRMGEGIALPLFQLDQYIGAR